MKNANSSESDENSDDMPLYEVEEIIKKRIKNGRTEYFIKWKGWIYSNILLLKKKKI